MGYLKGEHPSGPDREAGLRPARAPFRAAPSRRTAHRRDILAWYNFPIITGPLEGTNNKIKTMQRQANGFRDQEFFMLKIYALHESRYELVGWYDPTYKYAYLNMACDLPPIDNISIICYCFSISSFLFFTYSSSVINFFLYALSNSSSFSMNLLFCSTVISAGGAITGILPVPDNFA